MSLQGTLSTLGITEVLEFLASRSFSGQLDIKTDSGTASYLLVNGTIGAAEFDYARGSGTSAAEATYYVLSDIDGGFFFEEHDLTGAEEGDDVEILLGQTAEIADRWLEVEEELPSTSHLIIRNNELDSSVTIKPEWWKTLEVLGEGQSSAQLSELLDLGILDASTQALDMVKAGLLVVTDDIVAQDQEPAPEINEPAVETVAQSFAEEMIIHEPLSDDTLSSETLSNEIEGFAPETDDSAFEPPYEADEEAIAAAPAPPVLAVAETPITETAVTEAVVSAPEPAPLIEDDLAGAQVGDFTAMSETVEQVTAETPMSDDETSGVVLGFTNNLEPDGAPASIPTAVDDGWSTNSFYEDPVESAFPTEAFPVEPAVAEPTPEPMTFEAPLEVVPEMPAESLYGLDASFSDDAVAPVDSDALADEVMSDLHYLNTDLDEQLPEPSAMPEPSSLPQPAPIEEYNFDAQPPAETFAPASQAAMPVQASPVAEATLPPPAPTIGDSDPFGSLSDLVIDEEPKQEDRGSVLKFLRRD